MTPAPSRRQRQLLLALHRHRRIHGYSPSLRELQRALELRSISTIQHLVKHLLAADLVLCEPNTPRSLRLTPAALQHLDLASHESEKPTEHLD